MESGTGINNLSFFFYYNRSVVKQNNIKNDYASLWQHVSAFFSHHQANMRSKQSI
jgi:hypothetical protein